MRSIAYAKHYAQLMDMLIQAIVTYRTFRNNRTKNLFSDWVTVSDEAFLLLCLDNYRVKWRYQKLHSNTTGEPPSGGSEEDEDDEEDRKPKACNNDGEKPSRARWTGKDKGTKRSWSNKGLDAFNNAMMDVQRDRTKRGKRFDNLFLQMMKEKYEKPGSGKEDKHDKVEGQLEQQRILTDWDVQEYVQWFDKEKADEARARGEEVINSSSDSETSKHAV